jgi:hypothetical protein
MGAFPCDQVWGDQYCSGVLLISNDYTGVLVLFWGSARDAFEGTLKKDWIIVAALSVNIFNGQIFLVK